MAGNRNDPTSDSVPTSSCRLSRTRIAGLCQKALSNQYFNRLFTVATGFSARGATSTYSVSGELSRYLNLRLMGRRSLHANVLGSSCRVLATCLIIDVFPTPVRPVMRRDGTGHGVSDRPLIPTKGVALTTSHRCFACMNGSSPHAEVCAPFEDIIHPSEELGATYHVRIRGSKSNPRISATNPGEPPKGTPSTPLSEYFGKNFVWSEVEASLERSEFKVRIMVLATSAENNPAPTSEGPNLRLLLVR